MASTNTHVIEDAITLDGLRTFKQEADQCYAGTSTATTSKSGLMSDADKRKLDGIATGATANAGTVTSVATGTGLTGGTITGSGTVKAKLKSETAHTASSATPTNQSGRQYAVGVDKDGYLSVNVPWTDTPQNQSAFGNVAVGSTTIAADSVTDTLTLAAGSNVTLTPDAANDKVTIAATNTTALPVGACLIMTSKTAPSGVVGTWTFRKSFSIPLTDSTTYYLYERTA